MYTNDPGTVELCDDVTDILSYVFEQGDPPALTVTFQLRADREYDPAGSLRLHLTNGINHHYFTPAGNVVDASPSSIKEPAADEVAAAEASAPVGSAVEPTNPATMSTTDALAELQKLEAEFAAEQTAKQPAVSVSDPMQAAVEETANGQNS